MARAHTPMHVSFNHLFIMAKVVNGGNKKGKVGSSIFYTIKNSNNKVTQGERIYQPNVTNPQSESQRAQRMKMTPASNFYRALSGILNHSWEGVKYGAMSRQYFMKLAMSANQEIFPYVNKGTTFAVPGPYPISRGSLPSVSWKIHDGRICIGVSNTDDYGILGDFSTALEQANSFLHDGDQITLIAFYDLEDREQRTYVPIVSRFLLDSSSEEDLATVLGSSWVVEDVDDKTIGFFFEGFSETATLAAACVVVSRKNESDGQVWQRSTEVMAVTDAVLNEWMSPAAYAGALDSYKRSERVSDSDYYLNDAETESEAGGVAEYAFSNSSLNFTIGGTTELHASVLVLGDNGPVATCAKYGVYPEERPDGKNTWLETYIIRGRSLVLMDRYNLQTGEVTGVTAAYEGQSVPVLTPEQFVARFTDYTLG